MYVVRKYIKAVSAQQALNKDKTTTVHDLWIDNEWKDKELASCIGFDNGIKKDEED